MKGELRSTDLFTTSCHHRHLNFFTNNETDDVISRASEKSKSMTYHFFNIIKQNNMIN